LNHRFGGRILGVHGEFKLYESVFKMLPSDDSFQGIQPLSKQTGRNITKDGEIMFSRKQVVGCNLALLAAILLSGCGQNIGTSAVASGNNDLHGSVHGGQQPITGATIQLYAVGTTGDGSAATPLIGSTVTTDVNGFFTITGLFTCPTASSLVYLLASNGNPGLTTGTNNTAIQLLAALGKCNTLSGATFISVNEVTTVAAVAALASYTTSAKAIGSAKSDASGLSTSFTLASEYANTTAGSSPGTSVPAGDSAPIQQINSLANIIATCVNSSGGTAGDGSSCGNLFVYSTPSGGSAPTDVTAALLNIFNNPNNNILNLLSLISANPLFLPEISSPPPNWTVALTTTNPTLTVSATPIIFPATQPAFGVSTQTFILTNTGSSNITLSDLSVTGANPGDFSVSTFPSTLYPGDTCPITVMFLPAASGSRYADVSITSSASISPIYIPLSGTSTISSTAQVSFTSAALTSMPSRASFAGANMQLFNSGVSYLDTTMQGLAQTLNLGWVRFPAGTADDVYDWTTGQTPTSMVSQFKNNAPGSDYSTMTTDQEIVGGKQDGVSLSDFTTFLGTQSTGTSPTHAIGVVNVFTDTAASAGNLAYAAQTTAGINVDVWELGNEPSYFVPSNGSNFFSGAVDVSGSGGYLEKVSSYASAIKAQVPAAKVAVWIPPNATYAWTQNTASYGAPFWDELYTHSYPSPSSTLSNANASNPAVVDTNDNEITFLNGFLLSNTNSLVDAQLAPMFNGNSMLIEFSEYNFNSQTLQAGLYNADFIAEYAMRLSSDPHVTNVGMHVLVGPSSASQVAIGTTHDDSSACETAYLLHQTPLNTTSYNFGYYVSAPGLALQIINGVINTSNGKNGTTLDHSLGVLPTTVANSATATYYTDATYIPTASMPAIYAQAYSSYSSAAATTATYHVLLTNKSYKSQAVSIVKDGALVTQTLTTRSIGASDSTTSQYATEQNTSNTSTPVKLTPGSATSTVTVPAYGVMDVSWTQ